MVYPFFTKNFLLNIMIIVLLKISLISNGYITIPFKKYKINSLKSSTDEFINNYLNNNIYMRMQISQPSQNIIGKINSLEFELLMKNTNKSPFQNLNSIFNKTESSTFSIINEKLNNHFPNSKLVKDNFSFCTKYDINSKKCKNIKNYDNINFIYTEYDETEEEGQKKIGNKYSYLEIGLSYKSYYNSDKNSNSLLNNLVKNKYIDNKNWFITFFNESKNGNENEINNEDKDEGLIVFGIDPSKFFDIKYNQDNIFSCQGINSDYDYKGVWSIIFQEVKQKTLKADNKDVVIQNNLQGVINFNYNIIVGNNQYMDIIGNTFFWSYITKGVCKKQLAENKFYYFVCNSFALSMNEINENFPSLYFKQKEFNYIFELTPKDLFIQIGEQIFFLVVFNKNNPTKSFLLGNIFLKKYFFNFDHKNQKIFFYKDDKNKKNGNGENIEEKVVLHWYNSGKMFVVLVIMIFLFCIFGFYFGKRLYQSRKLRANELEEQFKYESPVSPEEKNLELKLNF